MRNEATTPPPADASGIVAELIDEIPETFEFDGDGYYDTKLTHLVRQAAARIQSLESALRKIAEHPEKHSDRNGSYAVGWAFSNVQAIARAAIKGESK